MFRSNSRVARRESRVAASSTTDVLEEGARSRAMSHVVCVCVCVYFYDGVMMMMAVVVRFCAARGRGRAPTEVKVLNSTCCCCCCCTQCSVCARDSSTVDGAPTTTRDETAPRGLLVAMRARFIEILHTRLRDCGRLIGGAFIKVLHHFDCSDAAAAVAVAVAVRESGAPSVRGVRAPSCARRYISYYARATAAA